MSTPPTRCCVQTQKGTRCANEPSPVRPSRMIGPVRLAACGLDGHQRALWSLPGFIRHDAYCGAFGCDRPSNAGVCPKHRDQYRDFGITEHMLLAQEAHMPTTPEAQTPPPAAPQEAADGGAIPSPAVDAVEPSEGDVADAPLFVGGTDSAPKLVARWGQKHTAPLDGLAALAARGQQPTAPGPTLAEVQAELERERERADRAELDAVAERARADEAMEELAAIAALLDPEYSPAFDSDDQPIPLPTRVQTALMPDTAYERELRKSLHAVEAELFEVDRTLQHLGAYGNGPTVDRLLKVLTPEDRRNILEVQAAEARMDLARLKACRLNPPPPGVLEGYAAKVAEVEARIAALDAGEVQG